MLVFVVVMLAIMTSVCLRHNFGIPFAVRIGVRAVLMLMLVSTLVLIPVSRPVNRTCRADQALPHRTLGFEVGRNPVT